MWGSEPFSSFAFVYIVFPLLRISRDTENIDSKMNFLGVIKLAVDLETIDARCWTISMRIE